MLIGEICKKCDIGKDTVRHYESLDLIRSCEKPAGSRIYRNYNNDTLERIELILVGKSLGFKLTEMQPWLDLTVSKELTVKDHTELILTKVQEIEEKIDVLCKMKSQLLAKIKK